jgi:hypothetical protein
MFRKFAISGSFPGPQRVDPEMVFIFSVDSSRVDAISGLLCNLMAAWKPEIDYFFFRNGHKRTGLTRVFFRNDMAHYWPYRPKILVSAFPWLSGFRRKFGGNPGNALLLG